MGQEVRKEHKRAPRTKKEYPKEEILTKEEADVRKIHYKRWYECEPGEYGLTDDGYVLYTRRKRLLAGPRGSAWIFGYKHVASKAWTGNGKHTHFSYGDSQIAGQHWVTQELGKKRTRDVIRTYVTMLLTGTVDWDVLGRMYRPDQQIPRATVKRLFKQEKVKDLIRQEVTQALAKKNISEESVLDMYIEAHGVAKSKQDAATMTRVAEDLTEILDMKPGKETRSVQFEVSQDLSDLVLGAEKGSQRALQEKEPEYEDLKIDAGRGTSED